MNTEDILAYVWGFAEELFAIFVLTVILYMFVTGKIVAKSTIDTIVKGILGFMKELDDD